MIKYLCLQQNNTTMKLLNQNNMAQTSVEWYVEKVGLYYMGLVDFTLQEIQEQAKAIHKEELHKCASFWRGKENEIEKPIFDEWYNETFKSKQ